MRGTAAAHGAAPWERTYARPGHRIGGILQIRLNRGPTDWKAAPREVCLRVGEAKIGAVTTGAGGSRWLGGFHHISGWRSVPWPPFPASAMSHAAFGSPRTLSAANGSRNAGRSAASAPALLPNTKQTGLPV